MSKFSEPISIRFLDKTPAPFNTVETTPWQFSAELLDGDPEFKYGIKIFGLGTYGIGQSQKSSALAGDQNWQTQLRPGFETASETPWHDLVQATVHVSKDAVNWQDGAEVSTTTTFAWGLGRWGCGDWGKGEPRIVTADISSWINKEPVPMASNVKTVTFMERTA